MNALLCIVIGLACWEGDTPPPGLSAPISVPKIDAPKLSAPKIKAPKLTHGQFFDHHCEAQPPDDLKSIYFSAASRSIGGPTDCELAKQGKAECDQCWATGDYAIESPAGAIGVGQFLPKTAAELGIDPENPREAIPAQARYVKWCRDGWNPLEPGRTDKDIRSLGLATYNWGRGSMYKDQRKNGWSLYSEAEPHLPKETRDYVRKIEGW